MDLPFNMSYIEHAFEKEKERYAWDMWISLYPNMTMGWQKFIKFEDFKSKLFEKKCNYTQKSNEEIINEFMTVIAKHEGR